jgi:hypothetical protein
MRTHVEAPMKAILWLGLAVIGSFLDWMIFFGCFFVYDEANHRVASLGTHTPHGSMGAFLVIPIFVNVIIFIGSMVLADSWAD